jgi:hypothetical protein
MKSYDVFQASIRKDQDSERYSIELSNPAASLTKEQLGYLSKWIGSRAEMFDRTGSHMSDFITGVEVSR